MILAPDFGYGGAERSVAAVSRLLANHYQVHVVVFNRDVNQVYPIGGALHSLDVKGGTTILRKIVSFFQRVNRLRRLKKKLGIELCLSFLEGADYVNLLARGKAKTIINIRGSKKYDANITGILGWIRKKVLIPFLYNRADAITVVSEGLKHELLLHFKIRSSMPFKTIPNFCSADEILRLATEPVEFILKLHSCPTLITVGRIAYEKGYDQFAGVFSQLVQIIPHAKWIIVGSGPFEMELKGVLTRKKLQYSDFHDQNTASQVWFTGYQKNPYAWMAQCNVFILCSRTEGFPNVLLEAMALGKPVVAADCPYGPADILGTETRLPYEREYGILLPLLSDNNNDIDTWVSKLTELLNNPRLTEHYSNQSKIRATYYSVDRIEKIWKGLIAQYR